MKRDEKEYFDYTIIYLVVNIMTFVILYSLCMYIIFSCIKYVILKIVVSIVALPICLEVEYHYVMKIVNPIVDVFIPKKWKQAEKEWIDSFKQNSKIEKMPESGGTSTESLKSIEDKDNCR